MNQRIPVLPRDGAGDCQIGDLFCTVILAAFGARSVIVALFAIRRARRATALAMVPSPV